jgi:predicted DNA-binding protein (UPF0251 family)
MTQAEKHEKDLRDLAVRALMTGDPSIDALRADPVGVAFLFGVELTEAEAERIRLIDQESINRWRIELDRNLHQSAGDEKTQVRPWGKW